MELNFLRQDEIWFVDRVEDHSSKICSLTEFKQWFDMIILDAYKLCRYGAIPCFKVVNLPGKE